MSTLTKEFEEYKLMHDFMHPEEPLKKWMNEGHFTDHYKRSWDEIMPVLIKADGIARKNYTDNLDISVSMAKAAITTAFDIKTTYMYLIDFINAYNKL